MNAEEVVNPALSDLIDIMPFIEDGTMIPVISNSFRVEEIFRTDRELMGAAADLPEHYDEVRTIDQQLTRRWAQKIGYPMSEDHNLARVAQYRQIESEDPDLPKTEYIRFLNDRLLRLCENEEGYEDKVKQL